jgi:hypothetical protein
MVYLHTLKLGPSVWRIRSSRLLWRTGSYISSKGVGTGYDAGENCRNGVLITGFDLITCSYVKLYLDTTSEVSVGLVPFCCVPS